MFAFFNNLFINDREDGLISPQLHHQKNLQLPIQNSALKALIAAEDNTVKIGSTFNQFFCNFIISIWSIHAKDIVSKLRCYE